MGKRSRACEECHRLKIKCQVNSFSGAKCERCARNDLECVPAASRLQRDRIRELEVQLQELSNALRDRSGSSSSSSNSSTPPTRSPSNVSDNYNDAILSFLDARIPPGKQQDILRLFPNLAGAAWPVVRLPMGLDSIREKSPILLLVVLVYSVPQDIQGTDLEVHDELLRETVHILGNEVIGRGQRSLELVQALLVATFWNKLLPRGQQGSSSQLLQLASDMAIDIGIAGSSLQPSPAAYFCRHEYPSSLEARRTWLACYVALQSASMNTRRPNPILWNYYHDECLFYLENKGEPSDILLTQIVRITQLFEEISLQLYLCEINTFVSGNEYDTYVTIENLKYRVDAWAAQVPPSLASSQILMVFHHMAMIHIHELVLHTPTNKASFAAPFIPGRINVKDYPKPASIIPPLKKALGAIIHHCHAVIDTAAEMDPAMVLSLPSFCFAPTLLYSLYVLVNALVAATDPGNTYGQCITKENFRIEECSLKLRNLTTSMKSFDPTLSCFTTRMVDATSWLEEWYNDYAAILQQYERQLSG
jgi:hypothetical protein